MFITWQPDITRPTGFIILFGGLKMITRYLNLKLLSILILSIYINLLQAGQGLSEQEMQQLMEQVQKMQECMAKVDQSAMEAQAKKAEKVQKEMKTLCDAGKRDKAQGLAIDYGKEASKSKVMNEIKKCSEMVAGEMQQMPMMQDMIKDYQNQHVCDSL